jgi:dTDP-4-dehydrorhamnose reductase
VVSTNEVFDGRRTDGRGYTEDDQPGPGNAYGASKLAGEEAARSAFRESDAMRSRPGAKLWIVRTAWLYGPPGNDFPTKILAAADRLPSGGQLRVVADEVGSPTFAPDLAAGMVSLLRTAEPGTYHLVNADLASRADWARAVLQGCARRVEVEPIGQDEFARPSRAPSWAVLDAGAAAHLGIRLRAWQAALADYLAEVCPP